MADIVRLEEEINKSGIKLRVILDKANIPYYTYRRRLKNPNQFTNEEIVGLSNALGFTNKQRDEIFLS